jgi:small-conductance mechanosensitive channel
MEFTAPILSRFNELIHAVDNPAALWQWPVIVVAFLLAVVASKAAGHHLAPEGSDDLRVTRLRRLVFSMVAMVVLFLLGHWISTGSVTPLIRLLMALMATLSGVSLVVYVANHVFQLSERWANLQTIFVRTIWVLFVLDTTGLLTSLWDVMESVAVTVDGHRLSLLQVSHDLLVVGVLLVLAYWLGVTLERSIMRSTLMETNMRVMVVKIVRSGLMVAVVVIALPLLGFNITFLSVVAGTLGVGIGFGLQKIASNYVSGFVILMEHSVRPGDVITVEGRQGTVVSLAARYTSLKAGDGSLFIIPNESLVGNVVINHTRINGNIGKTLVLEVAHGTDLGLALQLIEGILRANPEVLHNPEPSALVSKLTGHGAEIAVSWWTTLVPADGVVRSALLTEIHRVFRERGIRVPQTDHATAVAP